MPINKDSLVVNIFRRRTYNEPIPFPFTRDDFAPELIVEVAGLPGPQGEPGIDGHTPVKGVDYFDGADSTIPGPQGIQGPAGEASTIPGPKGDKGDLGNDGIDGQNGAPGAKGDTGAKGDKGDTGEQGPVGADSTVPGPKGDTGNNGSDGASGAKGDKGDTGDPGTTDYTKLQNIPSTFPPSSHSHAPGDVTGTAVVTNDSRLSDARTPTAHNQAESTITFTDIATGNAATGQHGYLPKLGGGTANFLRADGTWAAVANGGQPLGLVTLANDTLAQALATNINTKLTVTASRTLTTTVPAAGTRCSVLILTSGTTSYTITFGTGFKPTGTLSTGTSSAKIFVVNFISDGANLYEAGRTAAMTA